jgi:hypothetical protein
MKAVNFCVLNGPLLTGPSGFLSIPRPPTGTPQSGWKT